MKAKTHNTSASKMATVLITVFVFGTSGMAQPFQDASGNDAFEMSLVRLEIRMASIEQTIKYAAPSADYDEIRSALSRLDLLANKTENSLRYRVPDEEVIHEIEYAIRKYNLKPGIPPVMASRPDNHNQLRTERP